MENGKSFFYMNTLKNIEEAIELYLESVEDDLIFFEQDKTEVIELSL